VNLVGKKLSFGQNKVTIPPERVKELLHEKKKTVPKEEK